MATPTTSTSKYLQVVVADGTDKETTWRIDNPKPTVTRAGVIEVLNNIFAETNTSHVNFLINNSNNAILTFKAASIEEVVKTTTVLE